MSTHLKIGFMLPITYSVGSPFNGVREQALHQIEALQAKGHATVKMTPWEKYDLSSFDVIQFFQGGPALHAIETTSKNRTFKLVYAPIIDTDMPNWKYGIAAKAGQFHSKLNSIQSYYAAQGQAADATIARSMHERSKLVDGLGVAADKVHLVLNGCPKPQNVDACYARHKLDIEGDFILHISKYTNTNKNILNLIKAIGGSDMNLVIAGTAEEGAYKEQVHREAARFDNIRFVGRVDDKTRDSLYAACRVFCLPSYREGTGLVAVEAASYGASIVITSRGGPPDYFKNHAHYTKGTSAEEILEVTIKAWESTDSDNSCQKHVIENLTWENSAEALLDVYKMI